jgi:hypothetical protein
MFYDDLSVYPAFGGVVFAKEEGQRIAEHLGPKNKNLIMQNHGLLSAGGTVAEAAAFFIALERACQTQLLVEASTAPGSIGASEGILKKTTIDHETAIYTKKGTGTPEVMYMCLYTLDNVRRVRLSCLGCRRFNEGDQAQAHRVNVSTRSCSVIWSVQSCDHSVTAYSWLPAPTQLSFNQSHPFIISLQGFN